MKDQKFTVYRLYNRLTGDSYIGSTADLRKRVSVHDCRVRGKSVSGNSNTTSKLYSNIRQHGAENFMVMVISTHSSRKSMLAKEAALIRSQRPSLNTCGKR